MVKNLKEILVNIASLPPRDQAWILRQLTEEQLITFNTNKGPQHLQAAQRFRKIKTKNKMTLLDAPVTEDKPEPLPAVCELLAQKPPLYAAIVIEQGNYPWQGLFLETFDGHGLVKGCLQTHVSDLKPVIKNMVFAEWEQSLSFENYMESNDG